MQSKNYGYTDGIDDNEVAAASAAFYYCSCNSRTYPAWCCLNWSAHVKKLQRESQFIGQLIVEYLHHHQLLHLPQQVCNPHCDYHQSLHYSEF